MSDDDGMAWFHGFYMPVPLIEEIEANVATWPDLTPGQRARLRVLLRPATMPATTRSDPRDT